MKPQLPIFPTFFVSAGTQPVSRMILPDASSKAGFGRNSLENLNRDFMAAREARSEGDFKKAFGLYDGALQSLGPFQQIEGGKQLLTEALFESSVLAGPERAPLTLRRLHRFAKGGYGGGAITDIEKAKTKILKAHALMQHTSSAFAKQEALFEQGLDLMNEVKERIETEEDTALKWKVLELLEATEDFGPATSPRAYKKAVHTLKKSIERLDIECGNATPTKSRISIFHKNNKAKETNGGAEDDCEKRTHLSGFVSAITLLDLARLPTSPQRALFERALERIEEATGLIDPEASPGEADIHLSIGLITAEIKARQLVLANGRHDIAKQRKFAEELGKLFKSISSDHASDEKDVGSTHFKGHIPADQKNELIASYQADVAILMARLGLWKPALRRARAVTSGPFARTPASFKLLRSKIFEPFVDGYRVLGKDEIRGRAKSGSWLKRLRAAVRQSHSRGFWQSALYGALGIVPGVVVSFTNDYRSALLCMAGVGATTIFNRMKNGWMTDEAQYAAITGKYERTAGDTAKDVGRLVVHSAFDSVPWLLPASVVEMRCEGFRLMYDTVVDSAAMAHDKIVEGFDILTNADTYASIARSASNLQLSEWLDPYSIVHSYAGATQAVMASSIIWPESSDLMKKHPWLFLPAALMLGWDLGTMAPSDIASQVYHLYTYGAAAVFLRQMRKTYTDRQGARLNSMAKWFLPGAFMLSADIGRCLAHKPSDPSYTERVIRAGILTTESYLMMHVLGNVKWKWDKGASIATNLKELAVKTVNANPALPLTMVMTNAFTAPLGGYIQRDEKLTDIALIGMHGAAITACLMPITLGISGIIKRKIPIVTRAKEGWQDSGAAKASIAMRLYATITGGLSAFHTPYAYNRIFRSGTWDVIPAGLRTFLGWDTFWGQFAMSGTNIVHGNPISSRTWPELSGTQWNRVSLVEEFEGATHSLKEIDERLDRGKISKREAETERNVVYARIRSFFQKAGQVMHPLHLFMGHESLIDRLTPLLAVKMAFSPPTFPQLPDKHFLADFYLMLHGGHEEKLDEEQFATFLKYVRSEITDPSAYDTVRPLVKILALARDNMDPEYKEMIEEFFTKHPEVPAMANVDLTKLAPLTEQYRRIARRKVRRAVKMPFGSYEQRVNGHGRQERANRKIEGLFITH